MSTPWYEDDSFWRELGPALFNERRWGETADEVTGILRLVALPERAAILDLPCGPGRHSLEFARRGFRVTGVDRTPGYLDEAQRRATSESLDLELLEADMRDFVRPNAFDLVINLYTSFGYFEDAAEDQRVARNFYESLKPGGALIMDLKSKELLARDFRPRDWFEAADGALHLESREIQKNWSWIRSRWIRIEGTGRQEWVVEHRLYSAAELVILLGVVGFVRIECYGGFDGSPYDEKAKRLIVIARRGA